MDGGQPWRLAKLREGPPAEAERREQLAKLLIVERRQVEPGRPFTKRPHALDKAAGLRLVEYEITQGLPCLLRVVESEQRGDDVEADLVVAVPADDQRVVGRADPLHRDRY